MQFEAQTLMQWAGGVLGVGGSLALAMNDTRSGWGFVAYLASNAAWLAFGLATGVYALAVQHLAFTVVSGFGVWRWLVRPQVEVRRARLRTKSK
jgi:hypothetical protein